MRPYRRHQSSTATGHQPVIAITLGQGLRFATLLIKSGLDELGTGALDPSR